MQSVTNAYINEPNWLSDWASQEILFHEALSFTLRIAIALTGLYRNSAVGSDAVINWRRDD